MTQNCYEVIGYDSLADYHQGRGHGIADFLSAATAEHVAKRELEQFAIVKMQSHDRENGQTFGLEDAEAADGKMPAFADSMTKEHFLQLQSELETLELSIAKGEESDATDSRVQEIERLMERSPWVLHPDDGCILKASEPQGENIGA